MFSSPCGRGPGEGISVHAFATTTTPSALPLPAAHTQQFRDNYLMPVRRGIARPGANRTTLITCHGAEPFI